MPIFQFLLKFEATKSKMTIYVFTFALTVLSVISNGLTQRQDAPRPDAPIPDGKYYTPQ